MGWLGEDVRYQRGGLAGQPDIAQLFSGQRARHLARLEAAMTLRRTDPNRGPSAGRGSGPWSWRACQGLRGRYRVRRPVVGLVPSGFGVGDAAEGDFEAEGAELADVVGDLAADVALAFVVVRAEVLVAHAGVGQQLVEDLQLGVADRDLGFGFAAAAGQPPVAGALAGLGLAGRDGGLAGDGGQVPVAFLGLGSSVRLPDWWSSGVCPAQEARCAPVGNRVMSDAGLGDGVLGGAPCPSRASTRPAAAAPHTGPAAARSPRSARRSRR